MNLADIYNLATSFMYKAKRSERKKNKRQKEKKMVMIMTMMRTNDHNHGGHDDGDGDDATDKGEEEKKTILILPAGLVHALSEFPKGVLLATQAALQAPHS